MEITISQNTKDTMIANAKQIAIYQRYTNLIDGLQPVADLEAKYYHEWQELREAIATKSRVYWLHEAADIYYYANQLEAQAGPSWLPSALASLHTYGLDADQVERAALAKYNWRASAPNNKNEDYELALISAALERLEDF